MREDYTHFYARLAFLLVLLGSCSDSSVSDGAGLGDLDCLHGHCGGARVSMRVAEK